MPTVTINFSNTMNSSVSVGDTAYYVGAANISTPTGTTLESAETSSIVEIGEITSLDKNTYLLTIIYCLVKTIQRLYLLY